jgi:hypothetical protein
MGILTLGVLAYFVRKRDRVPATSRRAAGSRDGSRRLLLPRPLPCSLRQTVSIGGQSSLCVDRLSYRSGGDQRRLLPPEPGQGAAPGRGDLIGRRADSLRSGRGRRRATRALAGWGCMPRRQTAAKQIRTATRTSVPTCPGMWRFHQPVRPRAPPPTRWRMIRPFDGPPVERPPLIRLRGPRVSTESVSVRVGKRPNPGVHVAPNLITNDTAKVVACAASRSKVPPSRIFDILATAAPSVSLTTAQDCSFSNWRLIKSSACSASLLASGLNLMAAPLLGTITRSNHTIRKRFTEM